MREIPTWNNDDYETAIEEYPGYIGHTLDRDLFVGNKCLTPLEEIPWWDYLNALVELDSPREIQILFCDEKVTVEIYDNYEVAYFLDYVPGIKVLRDAGNPDAGPGAGSAGFVFFLEDNASAEGVAENVRRLCAAVKQDCAAALRELEIALAEERQRDPW